MKNEKELTVVANIGFHLFYHFARLLPMILTRPMSVNSKVRIVFVKILLYFFLVTSSLSLAFYLFVAFVDDQYQLLLMSFIMIGLFLGCTLSIVRLKEIQPNGGS